MAYIGNQIRQYSDRVVLDSLTASATANYTLQLNGSNYVPSSAESLTVSLNGIIQKPQNSYTVSGSTLSFASALTASDSIDFVIAERGITLQTPSAGSVNTEQLANNAVTTAKIADANVTSAKMFSGFKNGITEADQWRLTANLTNASGVNDITANLERNDTDFSLIGTGMTESSGVFTFPQTGIYLITVFSTTYNGATNGYGGVYINTTTDNSNYNIRGYAIGGAGSAGEYQTIAGNIIFDVTNTSTHKVKFIVSSAASFTLSGDSTLQYTGFTFIRLGDT